MSSSNFHRLVAFLVNICTYVLKELLIECAKNDQCHPGYTDLSSYILDAKIINAIHALKTVRQDKLRKLYPSPGVFDESALDVSLLVILLLEFHKNTYIQGEAVIQGDVKKALNEIRNHRNTLQHKHKTTDVHDREFKVMWESLKLSSMTLAKTARGPAFEQEISDKIDDLMINCLPGLPDILTDWFMGIVSDLRSQIADIQSTSTDIKEKTDIIPGINAMIRAVAVDMSSISRHLLGAGKPCFSDGYRSVSLTLIKTVKLRQGKVDTHPLYYSSIEFLPDDTSGRIAALDFDNMMLVLLNRDLQPIGHPYIFTDYVWDLTIMSSDRIFVSALNKFYILTVGKSSTFKLIKTLPCLSGVFDSLSTMSADTFAGCNVCNNPPAMMTVTDNTVTRTDFPDLEFTEKKYATNRGCVYYIKDTDSVVFTDLKNSTVHVYNRRDNTTLRIADERIVQPVGVCAGPGGSVFVCSGDTHSIVHISPTGYIIDCHKINMGCPDVVAFSPSDSCLVVSSVMEGQNHISSYKIE